MAEFRRSLRLVGVMPRRLLPPPALCGFVLLLVLVFSVSYAVGSAAGPVAPGMRGAGSAGTGTGGDGGTGGGSSGGMEDMPGMHGSGE
ncbi:MULTISPECIES: hypothetical protein [unclassified Streptomyces]|uniref:hypothetical protein n=1 Tax=unclassified Streptomyces TaxID=2593676 RepID=UPI002E2E7A75|nr:hypothetical protein [Streptomyces sp. NBC_00228]WSW96367.1 hypothetical protein OG714_44085 [Streptomyces sp. NBC_00989]